MASARICENLRNLWLALSIFALSATTRAQTLMPTPAPSPSASSEEETIIPTFETQKLARTYILDVPACLREDLSKRKSCWSDYWVHREDRAKSRWHCR